MSQLPSKVVYCFILPCLLILRREEGFKGRGNSYKAQLQPKEVNLPDAEGGRTGELCKATDALPVYGRKARAVTPSSSLLHTCKSFTGRKGGNKLRSLSNTWHSVTIEQTHYISFYPLWASNGPSIEMDQTLQPTLAWHKHRPPSPTWHRLSMGKDTLCWVNVSVMLLEIALHLKAGSFIDGRK